MNLNVYRFMQRLNRMCVHDWGSLA